MRPVITLSAVLGLVTAAHTSAAVLQLDLNVVTTDAGGAFGGTSHTGTLALSANSNSNIAILIDGATQTLTESLSSFTGSIDLDNGVIMGGSFDVMTTDGASYSASITAMSGTVFSLGALGFGFTGLTFNGDFSNLVAGSMFAGVDVTPFTGGQPGEFIQFGYNPNASGVDTNSNYELFVIPTPGTAALGALAMLGLASRRRRD